jgi:hypothetical protein
MANGDQLVGDVEFRAFRGARRSSVYRSHAVEATALKRIVEAAAKEHLGVLEQVEIDQQQELEPATARQLAGELTQLRSLAVLPELDRELTAMAEVANWCARSREKAWLHISPR